MICSGNEVMTLAGKAARGAGAPPGQAASFGRAALCHLVAGRDAHDLHLALTVLPEGPILDLPLFLLRCGEAAEEGVFEAELSAPLEPMLLSYLEAQPYRFEVETDAENTVRLKIMLREPNHSLAVTRLNLPDDLAHHMTTRAARLLVPESDASRLSGAGAGLTDND